MHISHVVDLLYPPHTYRQGGIFHFIACLGNTDVLLSKLKARKEKIKQNVKNRQ